MCEKITAGEFYTIVTRLQKKWWEKMAMTLKLKLPQVWQF